MPGTAAECETGEKNSRERALNSRKADADILYFGGSPPQIIAHASRGVAIVRGIWRLSQARRAAFLVVAVLSEVSRKSHAMIGAKSFASVQLVAEKKFGAFQRRQYRLVHKALRSESALLFSTVE